MIDLLKKYDEDYKIGRALLIKDNYEQIVVKKIHPEIEKALIEPIVLETLKELTKFDYRTNVDSNGDQHIWVYYYDLNYQEHKVYIVANIKNNNLISDKKNFIDVDGIITQLKDTNIEPNNLASMVDALLGVFRRGYDRPHD